MSSSPEASLPEADSLETDSPEANRWDAASIEQALAGTLFAGRVTHLETTTSTNTLAIEAAQAGAPEGSVWAADEQTAGRGRGGHTWHSAPREGLYVSILLRPRMPLRQALWLSLATGLAVQSAVFEQTGLYPDIRWPNDLLLNEKKFGGILVETSATPDSAANLRYAVIGIGLNVAHPVFPPDLSQTATSLRIETGTTWSREALLVSLLHSLAAEVARLEAEITNPSSTEESQTLLTRFAEASSWVRGKSVKVGEEDPYTGTTAGLDPNGFLRVLAADGTLHTVLTGGVRPCETRPLSPGCLEDDRFNSDRRHAPRRSTARPACHRLEGPRGL